LGGLGVKGVLSRAVARANEDDIYGFASVLLDKLEYVLKYK
jgi:hypothetical protein